MGQRINQDGSLYIEDVWQSIVGKTPISIIIIGTELRIQEVLCIVANTDYETQTVIVKAKYGGYVMNVDLKDYLYWRERNVLWE